MVRRDLNSMYNDFLNHLVLDKARSTKAHSDWSFAYNYVQWYFRVSHPYIILDTLEDPPRPSNQDILEEEKTKANHIVDRFTCMSSY